MINLQKTIKTLENALDKNNYIFDYMLPPCARLVKFPPESYLEACGGIKEYVNCYLVELKKLNELYDYLEEEQFEKVKHDFMQNICRENGLINENEEVTTFGLVWEGLGCVTRDGGRVLIRKKKNKSLFTKILDTIF